MTTGDFEYLGYDLEPSDDFRLSYLRPAKPSKKLVEEILARVFPGAKSFMRELLVTHKNKAVALENSRSASVNGRLRVHDIQGKQYRLACAYIEDQRLRARNLCMYVQLWEVHRIPKRKK